MAADRPEKTEPARPLYFDEALRLLPTHEFVRRWATFPHRRPRFQTQSRRS